MKSETLSENNLNSFRCKFNSLKMLFLILKLLKIYTRAHGHNYNWGLVGGFSLPMDFLAPSGDRSVCFNGYILIREFLNLKNFSLIFAP